MMWGVNVKWFVCAGGKEIACLFSFLLFRFHGSNLREATLRRG
jgi:hypothetical protein